jgi:hypothetical protein
MKKYFISLLILLYSYHIKDDITMANKTWNGLLGVSGYYSINCPIVHKKCFPLHVN